MNVVLNLNILDIENLKSAHIVLFMQLVRLADENNEVTVSVSRLMELVKSKNRKSVIDYLKVLRDNGLINFSSENGVSNTYKLNTKYYSK